MPIGWLMYLRVIDVYLEIPNWSPEMHTNWSLCMKLYISAPKDMEEAAAMFIEVCTHVFINYSIQGIYSINGGP